jgi:DNA repair protein RadC
MESGRIQKGEGHRRRLREKFLSSGLSGFHDYEVIELLLTIGTPRKDCKETAKEALKKFKTLQGVLEASSRELCDVKGIGPKTLFGIKLIKAVADRYLEQKITAKHHIHNSKDLFNYLYASIGGKTRECFIVLYLDAKNSIISNEILFKGTLTASSVYPREVVRGAIDQKAASLIFAHNHPSGDPEPSPEDIAVTRRLLFALRTVDITVHDHIVIGNNMYYSFADRGHIQRINMEYDKQGPINV